MAYTRRNWSSGEVVEAADANRWEQGIADAQDGVDGALTDAKAYTDQEVATRAPAVHDHPATDISDSSALGRTLMAVADAGTGRDALGIEVDTSVGTRVMVGGVMVHGDTGWREIDLTGTDDVVTGSVLLRRTDSAVSVYLQDIVLVAGAGNAKVMTSIPAGFRIGNNDRVSAAIGLASSALYSHTMVVFGRYMRWLFSTSSSGISETRPDRGVQGTFTFRTPDTWPTSLPGSPA